MSEQALLNEVAGLVRRVGRYQTDAFRSFSPAGGEEKVAREFVSEVDIESETRLIEGLRKLVPEAGVYAEESGARGETRLRWIIDPLDGTTNFLSGLDQFSISVALEQEEETILGIVYRPCSGESYTAVRGQGLFHNDRRQDPKPAGALKQALLGTGFPYRSPDLASSFFPCAQDLLYRCRGLRRFGSAALDLSYVASGFLQGFWESDLQPYDVAAALLFLKECGCRATNQEGRTYSPYRDRILVCAPPAVHGEMLPIVARHYPASL